MKTRPFAFFMSAILMLFFSGCTHRPVNRSVNGWSGWDHMMGGYGGMFVWLILIVVIAVVIYFVINRGKTTGNSINSTREIPMDILKKRYAKGEITKEEFDKLKKEIES